MNTNMKIRNKCAQTRKQTRTTTKHIRNKSETAKKQYEKHMNKQNIRNK